MSKIHLILTCFFVLPVITIYSISLLTISNDAANSQKVVLPKSFVIQNYSTVVIPALDEKIINTYKSKSENYSALNYSYESTHFLDDTSYTNTNATITVVEKLMDGMTKVDYLTPTQKIVIPIEKTVNGIIKKQ